MSLFQHTAFPLHFFPHKTKTFWICVCETALINFSLSCHTLFKSLKSFWRSSGLLFLLFMTVNTFYKLMWQHDAWQWGLQVSKTADIHLSWLKTLMHLNIVFFYKCTWKAKYFWATHTHSSEKVTTILCSFLLMQFQKQKATIKYFPDCKMSKQIHY